MEPRKSPQLFWFRTMAKDEADCTRGGWGCRLSRSAMKLTIGLIAVGGSAFFVAPLVPEEGADGLSAMDHVHLVQAGAFSADGRMFATCGLDEAVRLWDVNSLEGPATPEPLVLPDDTVKYSVAFSADGSLLAAVGPRSLTIWPTTAGKHTPILRQQTGSSSCLAFSPDGRTLAIGSDEGDITLHELPAASHRMVLRGHSNAVRSLSFSRDGNFLVSAGQDSLIMLWDTKRATPIRALLEGASNPNHIVAFSPDGRTVAVGETGGKPTDVLILEVNDGTIRTRLIGHSDGVCALAFSPDSRSLATASADHSVKLWNLDDGTEKTTFTEDVGRVNSLSFSSDGAWLEFAGDGIALRSLESTLRKLPRLGFISLPSPERISFTTEESAKKPGAGVLEQPQLRAFPVTAHSTL